MHQQLVDAERRFGIELPALSAAAELTARNVAAAKARIQEVLDDRLGGYADATGLDIVASGSMAREEMVPGSDFDYLVVVNKTVDDPRKVRIFREAAYEALVAIEADMPGGSAMFGVVVGAPELVNQIGLEQDTNRSLSRRMMFLQESIPLNGHSKHDALVKALLLRYLHDYEKDQAPRVPRFLFNDMLRFWRTIAVDYQAKRWEEMQGSKWGLRYLKLRSSRKWTFAGSVVSLWMPVIEGRDTTSLYLQRQWQMPPLARVAQLQQHLPHGSAGLDAIRRVLVSADQLMAWQQTAGWRERVIAVDTNDPATTSDEFEAAQEVTIEIQKSLEDLFGCPDLLGSSGVSMASLTSKYMTF